MTSPKEKAKELVLKYLRVKTQNWFDKILAKECALIAVDELINETGSKYWYDVKLEIDKL